MKVSCARHVRVDGGDEAGFALVVGGELVKEGLGFDAAGASVFGHDDDEGEVFVFGEGPRFSGLVGEGEVGGGFADAGEGVGFHLWGDGVSGGILEVDGVACDSGKGGFGGLEGDGGDEEEGGEGEGNLASGFHDLYFGMREGLGVGVLGDWGIVCRVMICWGWGVVRRFRWAG